MKKTNKFLLFAFATTGLLFGCGEDVLDVANKNNPDTETVLDGKLATPADMEALASGLFNTVFQGEHRVNGVEAMLDVAADNATCAYGNFGMWHMSSEPRNLAWDNTPNYTNNGQTKWSYDQWYSSIGTAVSVLKTFDTTLPKAGNERTLAFTKFSLGLAYGNMALVFDRAHHFDNLIPAVNSFDGAKSYQDIATAAIGYLDEAIALTDGSFSIPAAWLGTSADVSGADFKKIINTAAARILSYMPRNKTENAAVNWAKVKTYADAGITADFIIQMDGTNKWYFEAADYLTYPGWGQTDMYVVHMMEPSQPDHWGTVARPQVPKAVDPMDDRLDTDFQYLSSNTFRVDRGYFNFSNYRYSRYDAVFNTVIGPHPYYMKAENDLLKAEARAYTGDVAGAAAIINAGTRATRGGLAPVASTLADVIQAIHHERHVECYTTSLALQFFEMRKLDLLQKGTPLHLPTPGAILQLFGQSSFYTFGTVAKADGVGTSNAGWR